MECLRTDTIFSLLYLHKKSSSQINGNCLCILNYWRNLLLQYNSLGAKLLTISDVNHVNARAH